MGNRNQYKPDFVLLQLRTLLVTCAWSTLGPVPQDALRSFFKFFKGHAFSDFRRTAVDFIIIKNNVTLSRPGFVFIYLFIYFFFFFFCLLGPGWADSSLPP